MAKALVLSEEALAAPVSGATRRTACACASTRAKSSEAREAPKGSASTAPNPHRGARRQGHQASRLGSRPDDQRIHACMLSCSHEKIIES